MRLNYPDANTPLAAAIDRWMSTGAAGGCATLDVAVARDWLPEPDTHRLAVRYRFRRASWGIALNAEVAGRTVDLDAPVELAPIEVPKPWGREIWFTGIEARGECAVRAAGGELPLSSYVALAPAHLTSCRPVVLLKILDPRPEPALGELYFEVHQEKRELYVVIRVDPAAWPDGTGAMRFGMDPELRARYADDDAFRRDYLRAVQAYEALRRRIDAGADVAPADEHAARAAMERFTALRPLAVGDGVVVPTWLPHALQHGVRVVEFQTPTYERYVISFAQKIVTQDRWDSAYAVPRMTLDVPAAAPFEVVAPGVERLARFDDFGAWRVTLPAGGSFDLPGHPAYALCMVAQGSIALGALTLGPEGAAFVPGATLADPARRQALAPVSNPGPGPAVLLIAAPDL